MSIISTSTFKNSTDKFHRGKEKLLQRESIESIYDSDICARSVNSNLSSKYTYVYIFAEWIELKLQTKNIQRSRTRLSSRLKGKLFVNGDFETGLDRDITSIANQIIDLKRERTVRLMEVALNSTKEIGGWLKQKTPELKIKI